MDEGGVLSHRRLYVNSTGARALEDAEAWPVAPPETIAEDAKARRCQTPKLVSRVAKPRGYTLTP
jgi:hypothetical protein